MYLCFNKREINQPFEIHNAMKTPRVIIHTYFTLKYEGYYCDSYKSLDKAIKIAVSNIKGDEKNTGEYTISLHDIKVVSVQLINGNIIVK